MRSKKQPRAAWDAGRTIDGGGRRWGFAPKKVAFVDTILLWLPQPQSSSRALPFATHFILSVFKPLARGLGRSPKWERKAKAGRTHQTFCSFWGEAPITGCRGTEVRVCPVGTCAKRKANRRSQPKRVPGTAVPGTTIEVAGIIPLPGRGAEPHIVPPQHGFVAFRRSFIRPKAPGRDRPPQGARRRSRARRRRGASGRPPRAG